MIVKSELLNVRNVKRFLIAITAGFTLFSSIPEIHIFGFSMFVDIGRAANASEVNIWNTSQCSGVAAAWATIFGVMGTLGIYLCAFSTGLVWAAIAKKATPLTFAAKALSILLLLLGVIFWGISIYIAGKCGYLYVSTLLF